MNKTIMETQGVEVTTLDATLKAADLNWEPLSDEIEGSNSGVVMPRKKILYRSDNRQPLGIVGADYEPSQPKQFLAAQLKFAESIGGTVTRAGFIPDRARAFTFIKVGEPLVIARDKRQVGDPVQAFIYTTDGWDGCTPHKARLYVERLRCANGMTSREITSSLWISHTSGMESRFESRRKAFQGQVTKMVADIRTEFTTLVKARMTEVEAKEFIAKLIPGESTRSEKRREVVLGLFHTGEGNQGATRWDAYNAVTEYVTHHQTYRTTEATSVETNRFLGVLETNTLSRTALNLLLN